METLQNERSLSRVSEVQLVYRNKVKAALRPRITASSEAYALLMQYWDQGRLELQEEFKVLLLNNALRVLGIYAGFAGGMDSTLADPRLIFVTALKARATGILVAHNHPSGKLKPSEPDFTLTKRLVSAGELLNIDVVDHLIVSADGFYSFMDEGVL